MRAAILKIQDGGFSPGGKHGEFFVGDRDPLRKQYAKFHFYTIFFQQTLFFFAISTGL